MEQVESERIPERHLRKAREMANWLFTNKYHRIDPHSFTEYSRTKTRENLAKVAAFKESRRIHDDDEGVRNGMIAEAFLFDMIESNGWFGKDVSIKRTSEYDDFMNHVDALVGFHMSDPSKILTGLFGLSIDVTKSPDTLFDKIDRLYEGVKTGHLGQITYAEMGTFRGQLGSVPHGVLYIDPQNFADCIRKWAQPHLDERSGANPRELRAHHLQIELLAQLSIQMRAFAGMGKASHNEMLSAMEKTINTRLLERIHSLGMSQDQVKKILAAPSLTLIRDHLRSYQPSAHSTK